MESGEACFVSIIMLR